MFGRSYSVKYKKGLSSVRLRLALRRKKGVPPSGILNSDIQTIIFGEIGFIQTKKGKLTSLPLII